MAMAQRRRLTWLAVLPVAIAITGPSLPARAPPLPVLVDFGTRRWEGARIGRDDRTLVVLFTGGSPQRDPFEPCWTGYRTDVAENDTQVTVTLVTQVNAHPRQTADTGCTLVGWFRTITVRLRLPLGDRPVVDGTTGDGPPVLRTRAPRPRFLPHGWKLSSQRVTRSETGAGVRLHEVWAPPGGAGRCGTAAAPIELTQGPVEDLFPYGPREDIDIVRHRRVGRVRAQLLVDPVNRQTVVRWKDRGRGYILRRIPTCDADPLPRPELLVRVANSVR